MMLFLAQLVLFVVGLRVFKEAVELLRKWCKEFFELLDPDKIRARRQVKVMQKQFEQEAQTEKEDEEG